MPGLQADPGREGVAERRRGLVEAAYISVKAPWSARPRAAPGFDDAGTGCSCSRSTSRGLESQNRPSIILPGRLATQTHTMKHTLGGSIRVLNRSILQGYSSYRHIPAQT